MVSNSKKEKGSKQHKHRSDHDRVEKVRDRERRSPSDDDRSRSPTPTKSNANEASHSTRDNAEHTSLSIEETNKLRASLGLKPLTVNENATNESDTTKKGLNSDENFVHRPPENLTEKKRTEELTRKLNERKEARTLQGKFLTTPILASEPAESASSWIEKMRQTEEEKRKAAARAKLLEQMDEEFGVGNIIQEEVQKQKQKKYISKDLTGLRVEHSIEEFKEGQQVILTLKDKKILRDEKDDDDDNDDEDVLININIADNELAKQRADLSKKKTPGYRAYDDDAESADQFGMFNPNKLLEQYDEKKKQSFRLAEGGTYDMSDEKMIDDMKQEIRTRMQSLAVPTHKVASEFYSAAEMEQFKKPKKVTKKKIRDRKMLKADDLLPMDSSEPQEASSSATTSVFLRPAEIRRPTAISSASKERSTTVSLDKIKRELVTTTAREDEDVDGPNEDLSNVAIQDDAFDELQAVVNRTVKLKAKKDSLSAEKALSGLIEERDRRLKVEIKSEPMETGIILPPAPTSELPDDKSLVLDTMSEFCRNVGENMTDSTPTLPTIRAATKLKRTNAQTNKKQKTKTNVALDPDDELLQHALEHDGLDDDAMDDTPAEDVNTKPFRLEDTLLSDEPILDRGLGSALRLATQKGYIEQEKSRKNARMISDITAINYTVEEKSSYDIEDKHARRDRYTSGPIMEFKEKEHYRPEVKLEYVDDGGRRLNPKEAFRDLSHRFHGKGSGKKKTEKRTKKLHEEEMMKKMSNVDTPLQTYVMSQPVIIPPVHDTSPPPFDDDVDENDLDHTIPNDDSSPSNTPDVLNNSNDEWKSVDDNNDTDIAQIQEDIPVINSNENNHFTTEENNDDEWANFATFENKIEETSEEPPATTLSVNEEDTEDTEDADWADFESNTAAPPEPPVQTSNDDEPTNEIVEDDDFGEFSEVQVTAPPPPPPPSSAPTNTLSSEQIETIISTCFPIDSEVSFTDTDAFLITELPSFTSYKDPTKQISYLESSLSLWDMLSNLSNDPTGIKFQWRKSNTERLFHQALGVTERLRTKTVPLTPEILQPEKAKPMNSTTNESENAETENKLSSEPIRPHFDWKHSGLQDPLADNDSSSLSSNLSKTEDNVFDANRTLDLDFYVPTHKSSNEEISPSSAQKIDSPIISQQRHSIPIKTTDLYPNSTTTLNDDTKRIVDSLPNLSFMSAKALMFPIRFNTNTNDEPTTLY